MRLQLQMAGDLSKLVSFSKLKWQVTIYHFTSLSLFVLVFSCFFAQIAAPAGKGITVVSVDSRAPDNDFFNTVK